MTFTFVLIGRCICDYFRFGFTTLNRKALYYQVITSVLLHNHKCITGVFIFVFLFVYLSINIIFKKSRQLVYFEAKYSDTEISCCCYDDDDDNDDD